MSKTLLSVGTNHSLLGLRNRVLAAAGYAVVPAKSASAALKIMNSRPLDAVILGHSLSPSLKEIVLDSAKSKGLPVIVLHAYAYEAALPDAYANLCGIDGAARIAEVLSDLFAVNDASTSASPLPWHQSRQFKGVMQKVPQLSHVVQQESCRSVRSLQMAGAHSPDSLC
jgi:response regulator RpfG family c-di-GMP phosphodiesterase